jgi:hypothetical protein
MKRIRTFGLIVICFLAQRGEAQELAESTVKYPTDVVFLSVPTGAKVKLADGGFQISQGGQFIPLNLSEAQKETSAQSEARFILGSPALITKVGSIDVSSINENNKRATEAALVDGKVIAVVEKRVQLFPSRSVETHFMVFRHDGGFEKLSEFKLVENPYNLYLDQAYALGKDLVAIILRSSRHPYVNAIVMFDTSKSQAIGYREFSDMQYLPRTNSIWIAQSVPNCDNLAEAVADAHQQASVFPIFKGGKLNSAFCETAELEAVPGD